MTLRPRLLLGALAAVLATLPAAPASAFKLETLAPRFDQPVYATGAPGDTARLFVVEQPGRIQVVRDGRKSTFLDITGRVEDGGEKGLLSVAFPPDYASSGLFYVFYTRDAAGDGSDLVVEQRRRGASADVADPAYAAEVLRIPHPDFGNHNGGQLQFGPDGNLWIGTGDGGSGGDPRGNAQNRTSLLGKILRVTPRRGGGYAIPAGNAAGGRGEIWGVGLRNPWRFSFDPPSGQLWIGDVGQNAVEEINRVDLLRDGTPNFGWRRYEGNRVYAAGDPEIAGHHAPLITHTHDDGWFSITGGYVIRDASLAEAGRYVYGDFAKGELFLADPATGATRSSGVKVDSISGFGRDTAGRIYVVSLGGTVRRLVSDVPPAPPGTPDGPAGPSAPGADRTAPRVGLSTKRRQRGLRKRRVYVRVKCSEACRLALTGRVAMKGRSFKVRTLRRSLRAGRARTIQVKLGPKAVKAGRRAARKGRKVVVRLRLRLTDAAGNTRTRRVTIRVRG